MAIKQALFKFSAHLEPQGRDKVIQLGFPDENQNLSQWFIIVTELGLSLIPLLKPQEKFYF